MLTIQQILLWYFEVFYDISCQIVAGLIHFKYSKVKSSGSKPQFPHINVLPSSCVYGTFLHLICNAPFFILNNIFFIIVTKEICTLTRYLFQIKYQVNLRFFLQISTSHFMQTFFQHYI